MEKVILGFLGTGKYDAIAYEFDGKRAPKTKLSVAAVKKLFPDHRPILLTTQEAYERNWSLVEESFADLGLQTPERIEIPSGKTEEEIWDTVEKLVGVVPRGVSVVLDVTHGFRTMPLLVFVAMGLLSKMGRASVERVLYGAYEARDEDTGVTPVLDLSPLLRLTEWANALGDLQRYGYATPIRDLLRDVSGRAHREKRDYRPTGLVNIGDDIRDIARALSVIRPQEAHDAAARLAERLPKAQEDMREMPELRPLAPFLQESMDRYIGIGKPKDLFSREGMPALGEMIRLHIELEQYPQAITLAREALVTLRMLDNDVDPLDPEARRATESEINAAATILKLKGKPGSDTVIPYAELWNELADLRNDVDHAGFRKNARASNKVMQQAQKLGERVAAWLSNGKPT